jgi:hypothetical protein
MSGKATNQDLGLAPTGSSPSGGVHLEDESLSCLELRKGLTSVSPRV